MENKIAHQQAVKIEVESLQQKVNKFLVRIDAKFTNNL